MSKEEQPKSEKQLLARNGIPESLREEFDGLVDDYRFSAAMRYHQPFVSYVVLADMIRAGWRRVADPIEDNSGEAKGK